MHGGGGAAVTTSDADEILRAVAFHRRHGTTRTLASLVTAPLDEMVAATKAIARIVRAGPSSSGHVVGAHLEGPFLHPKRRGSHDPTHLLAPDPAALRALLDAGAGTVRVVTLAPELPGGMELLRDVVAAGAVAAVGHTDASYDEASAAFRAGSRLATHLFNAMRPLHHREPGAAGAALDHDSVTCELISDGIHVHEEALRLVFAAAGPGRVALITDATPAAGMAEGHFHLGPVPIMARGGRVTLLDGVSLAGSTLTMDAAVRHAVRHAGISLLAAARAASTTPAHVLGIAGRVGSIRPGLDADLVVLTADLDVAAVIVAGTVAHGSLDASTG
jgi:N-acetylglucosamine-6-phosphate deacetylase